MGRCSLIIITVLLNLFIVCPVKAQEQLAPVDLLEVVAKLNTNGQVSIEQTVTFVGANSLQWDVFTNLRDLEVIAQGEKVKASAITTKRQKGKSTIRVKDTFARQWTIRYQTTTTLIRTEEQDRIFLQLLNEPGRVIAQTSARFTLPESVKESGLFGNAYAIHGASNPQTKIINNNELLYTTDFVGPEAIFTLNATWPKSVLRLSTTEELRLALLNLEILPWLISGIGLPILSLLVLVTLLIRQRRSEMKVKEIADRPPSTLSPMLVGVLVNKKIYPEEIVAMLIDLCRRGYLLIIKRNGHYFLGQRKTFDQGLEEWERQILDEFFPISTLKLDEKNLKAITQGSLYSPEIREVFGRIYEIITSLHYFSENPHLTRVRYKLIGLAIYFASNIGLLWTAVTDSSPYLLIPLVGSLVLSFLIIKLTPTLIGYTPEGKTARAAWMSFGNYLKLEKPLPFEAAQNHLFENYLPYAVALHCVLPWANRFDISKTVLVQPDWLITFDQTDAPATNYAKEISEFIGTLSELIASMRGPLVS